MAGALLLTVAYQVAYVYMLVFVTVQSTPTWLRNHILAQSTAAKVFWLFGFQTLGIVLISLPFGIVIAKVYRRVGVWFAFFITLLAWWIVAEASILIHRFLWFRIGRDLELVCVLPAIVWILSHRKPAAAA